MPITIDENQYAEQDTDRKRDMFKNVELTEEQKEWVGFRKMESLNPELSDVFHPIDCTWMVEETDIPQALKSMGVSPRIFLKKGNEETPIGVDDGYIFQWFGTCAGERGIDTNGDIISVEAAEDKELSSGDELGRINLWEFRLGKLIKTDGPQRTQQLQETMEQQRQDTQDDLVKTITKAFASVSQGGQLNANTMATSPEDVKRALVDVEPDARAALFQMAEMESGEDNGKS